MSHRLIDAPEIPPFTHENVLPAVGVDNIDPTQRSPWQTDMRSIVDMFAVSLERIELLELFFDYREVLRSSLKEASTPDGIEVEDTFQWIDGSFVENINRPPGDIDVANFLYVEQVLDEEGNDLHDPSYTKEQFKCDPFGIYLGWHCETIVEMICCMYCVYSQRKSDLLPKGFLQVRLFEDDSEAIRLLNRKKEALSE